MKIYQTIVQFLVVLLCVIFCVSCGGQKSETNEVAESLYSEGETVSAVSDLEYANKTIKAGSCGVVKQVLKQERYEVLFNEDNSNRIVEESDVSAGCTNAGS